MESSLPDVEFGSAARPPAAAAGWACRVRVHGAVGAGPHRRRARLLRPLRRCRLLHGGRRTDVRSPALSRLHVAASAVADACADAVRRTRAPHHRCDRFRRRAAGVHGARRDERRPRRADRAAVGQDGRCDRGLDVRVLAARGLRRAVDDARADRHDLPLCRAVGPAQPRGAAPAMAGARSGRRARARGDREDLVRRAAVLGGGVAARRASVPGHRVDRRRGSCSDRRCRGSVCRSHRTPHVGHGHPRPAAASGARLIAVRAADEHPRPAGVPRRPAVLPRRPDLDRHRGARDRWSRVLAPTAGESADLGARGEPRGAAAGAAVLRALRRVHRRSRDACRRGRRLALPPTAHSVVPARADRGRRTDRNLSRRGHVDTYRTSLPCRPRRLCAAGVHQLRHPRVAHRHESPEQRSPSALLGPRRRHGHHLRPAALNGRPDGQRRLAALPGHLSALGHVVRDRERPVRRDQRGIAAHPRQPPADRGSR